jgi:hypothetical protein
MKQERAMQNETANTFTAKALCVAEPSLCPEVSDAALEQAAGVDMPVLFTLGNCTGLDSCPA